MPIRVPLISPVDVVIYPLDVAATWADNPPGDLTTGYDPILREPVISVTAGVRTIERIEGAAIVVPCQVEILSFEQLRATFPGADPVTDLALVFHRRDLKRLGLIDAVTGCPTLKTGDRIDHFEKRGIATRTFTEPIYIYELRPKSWGFGPDGYDLDIGYTSCRAQAISTAGGGAP